MKELEVELEELRLLVVAMGNVEGNRGVVPVVPVGEQ